MPTAPTATAATAATAAPSADVAPDTTVPPAPAKPRERRVSSLVKTVNLLAVVVPFVALIVAVAVTWGWGVNWVALGAFAVMYVLTVIGVTLGYHRLFTHRSYETLTPIRATLAVLGSMAVQGPVLYWVAIHRRHHQHADHAEDPHSPHVHLHHDHHDDHGPGVVGVLKGLWHAHAGWLLMGRPENMARYVGDLRKDKLVRTISRLFPLWVALGLLLPAVACGLLTMSWSGALLGFLWGGLVRVFFVHHVTWSINSVCHLWGYQSFRSDDESRNNPVFGILGLGEGWHNNHHAFPTSARHGLRWWEVDATYLLIRAMEATKLAWKVRRPTADAMAAKHVSAG